MAKPTTTQLTITNSHSPAEPPENPDRFRLSDSRAAGHADSTMRQDLILLRHVARYAVLLGIVTDDFTAGIKAPSSLQGKPSKRARLTPDQVRAVAAHIGGTLGDAIMLDLYTGLRLSELLGLKASKLTRDGDSYVLAINEQWDERAKTSNGNGLYRLPKRDKNRDVPVTTELHELLDKHLLKYPADHTHHRIMFATRNGTHFLQSNVRKVWNRALRDLGLPHCSPHSIRATCVDLWIDRGVSFENVATMVGHSSPDITRNVYRKQNACSGWSGRRRSPRSGCTDTTTGPDYRLVTCSP